MPEVLNKALSWQYVALNLGKHFNEYFLFQLSDEMLETRDDHLTFNRRVHLSSRSSNWNLQRFGKCNEGFTSRLDSFNSIQMGALPFYFIITISFYYLI